MDQLHNLAMSESRWESYLQQQADFRTLFGQSALSKPENLRRERTCRRQTEYRNKVTSGDLLLAFRSQAKLGLPGCYLSSIRRRRTGSLLPVHSLSALHWLEPQSMERAAAKDRDRAALF